MKVNIIGRGNVGSHLIEAFSSGDGAPTVIPVNPRSLEELDPDADFTLIAVADSALKEVLSKIPRLTGIIAHTAGSIPIDIFSDRPERHGIMYPLQTFTKGIPLSYSEIPFFIEASDSDTGERLSELARMVSDNVSYADSEHRRALHVASVFSCNFVNHMFTLSDDFLRQRNLEFSALLPLIKETVRKAGTMSPEKAQTGPASRGDRNVIDSHLRLLEDNPKMKQIYSLISESILSEFVASSRLIEDERTGHS